jgi:DNA uptake protein ComE-like DNA-binding protein
LAFEEFQHNHPGQTEPRAHGETHHENGIVDLNTPDQKTREDLPIVGPDRARADTEARRGHDPRRRSCL